MEKALKVVLAFAEACGVTPTAILSAKGTARWKAIEDATEALLGTDVEKQTYLRLEGHAWKLYKAALPDQRAAPYASDMAALHVLADRIRALKPRADVFAVMNEIEVLLDESIVGHAIRAPIRDEHDLTGLF